jgi:RNase H-fold protein (predicted Holliday junction resolvase)
MTARSIVNFLTRSDKVAHALDWRKVSGSILNISVKKNKIGLAVASHPCFDDPIQQLPSIPLETETVKNRKVLKSFVVEELSSIVEDFQVCGMVVSWPVRKEGRCGSQCGRVLHTLDQLTAQSKNLMSSSRPICLWDSEHNVSYPEDEWGRSAAYSKTSAKTFHKASKEQYEDHNLAALDVWNDFCRSHWPELYEHQRHRASSRWEERRNRTLLPIPVTAMSWLESDEALV